MKKTVLFCVFVGLVFVVPACKKSGGKSADIPGKQTISYAENNEDFANPERGFYRYTETTASSYTPLSQSQLEQWRGLNGADGGNYAVYTTLVFRYFILDEFRISPLSDAFLKAVKNDFAIARAAGVKLIPRFAYTATAVSGNCPEGFICPPYGDAAKEIVLQHIAQLKSVLQQSADVIAVVQLGFVGTWGEGYYTDHFGDASQNGQSQLLDNNWKDRADVLQALLDALPADRMVQVRYPQAKQRFVYGVQASVNVPALLESEAYVGNAKSRIGFHNDCFLASADDYGTYDDYGNSSSPRGGALATLKAYFKEDSRYVAVGGETCDDTFSPQNDCAPAGAAEEEMRSLHYSYLNCAYNNSVNNDWETGGCMMNIRKNLGYRFMLQQAVFPTEANANESFSFTLSLANKGYAAPFNPRPAKLIFRNTTTSEEYSHDLPTDVRKWYPGEQTIDFSITLASNLKPGSYKLFLYLPDAYTSIASRPEYAVRLANAEMWEATTGDNDLDATVAVK